MSQTVRQYQWERRPIWVNYDGSLSLHQGLPVTIPAMWVNSRFGFVVGAGFADGLGSLARLHGYDV